MISYSSCPRTGSYYINNNHFLDSVVRYISGDFCKAVNCQYDKIRSSGNKEYCLDCMAYRFHSYLDDNKFTIIKFPNILDKTSK